jgi:putative hydrolase of the HAD superfamily
MGRDEPELARAIASDYRSIRKAGLAPYPGAIETLDWFRDRGVPMALITNGPAHEQRASIERFRLEQYFDCIVIEGEFGVGKPDERVFRHALAATGCHPSRAWMVGDNLEADIGTPHRLGMHTVWVDAEGRGLPDGAAIRPHRVVRTIAELV